jgi:pilus assembly protein CpaE
MAEKKHILIVEDSEITLYKLKAILIRLGYLVTAHDNSTTALGWLKTTMEVPDLIISDVMMPGMDGYELIKNIRSETKTKAIPVILLTSQSDLKDKVAGLEAGADDYVSKTVSPAELELRVKALLTRSQGDLKSISQSAAKTFTVFSLRGGVGTTSIAVNLSIAIAQMLDIETCLWDMALSSSQCALLLNLKPTNTPVSLVEWPEETIEESLLRTMLLNHETGIKLLPAPQAFEEADLINKKIVDLIWPQLQTISPYTVVDAGNHFTDPVISILERSDVILYVLAPELASVNAAYQALRIFDEMGFDSNKVLLILNEIVPRSALNAEKISKALKKPVFADIPFDTINFVKAINQGTPYLSLVPKSDSSTMLSKIAYRLTAGKKEPG